MVLWNRLQNDCHTPPDVWEGIRKCLFLIELSLAHPTSAVKAAEFCYSAANELVLEISFFRDRYRDVIDSSKLIERCLIDLIGLAVRLRNDAYSGEIFKSIELVEAVKETVNDAYLMIDDVWSFTCSSGPGKHAGKTSQLD